MIYGTSWKVSAGLPVRSSRRAFTLMATVKGRGVRLHSRTERSQIRLTQARWEVYIVRDFSCLNQSVIMCLVIMSLRKWSLFGWGLFLVGNRETNSWSKAIMNKWNEEDRPSRSLNPSVSSTSLATGSAKEALSDISQKKENSRVIPW